MKILVAEQCRHHSMDTEFYILEADEIGDIQLFLGGYFPLGLDTFTTVDIDGCPVSIKSHDFSAYPNGHSPNAAPMFFGVYNGIYDDVLFVPEDQSKADAAIGSILEFLSGGEWDSDIVKTIKV